jgi:hypothetical protein
METSQKLIRHHGQNEAPHRLHPYRLKVVADLSLRRGPRRDVERYVGLRT